MWTPLMTPGFKSWGRGGSVLSMQEQQLQSNLVFLFYKLPVFFISPTLFECVSVQKESYLTQSLSVRIYLTCLSPLWEWQNQSTTDAT